MIGSNVGGNRRSLQSRLAFYGLGQAGVIVYGPDGAICIDPYLSYDDGSGGRMERLYPPPRSPDDLTEVDLVLVTHDHIDHFDPSTLGPLAQAAPDAVFAGPHTCDFSKAGLDGGRVLSTRAFEPLRHGTATVTPVPAAHESLDEGAGGYPYYGWVIEWNGAVVYHSGDTLLFEADPDSGTPGLIETLSRWRIDVMFIPINGRDFFRRRRGLAGNTDAREAALLAEELDVGLVIPTHYDLLAANGANPAHFVDVVQSLNPSRKIHLLRPAENYLLGP